jgi:hypothetical protein
MGNRTPGVGYDPPAPPSPPVMSYAPLAPPMLQSQVRDAVQLHDPPVMGLESPTVQRGTALVADWQSASVPYQSHPRGRQSS